MAQLFYVLIELLTPRKHSTLFSLLPIHPFTASALAGWLHMDDPSGSEQLIQELDRKRDAYIEVLQRTHTTLTTAISATRATCGDLSQHRTVIEDDQLAEKATMAVAQRTDSDHDLDAHSSGVNEEQCYAQGRVARLELDREGLRRNVCLSHPASGYTKKILGLKDMSQDRANTQDLASPRVSYADLILKGLELKNDRSRCEIVDVGVDGRAVAIDHMEHSQGKGGAKAIWKALSENLPSLDSPVGRIIVAHDFSPALSAALHYIAQGVFDVDEIFVFLAKPGLVRTGVQDLSSPLGEWRHRTFDFDILYFTLVNQEHEPWHWEDCSPRNDGLLENIRLSRCSSHVALALSGDAVGSVKHTQSGMEELACLFDTFGPWQILNAQCYPDYRKEGFCMWEEYPRQDSYLCGPEAFMATLLSEYHEAYSRMHNLYDAICWLVVPSAECGMFVLGLAFASVKPG